MYRFLGEALHGGDVPLWNPFYFGGFPAAADPQSLLFTPSMALLAFLAPNASMSGFDAMIYAHLLLGGIGVLGLGRRWRWSMPAALLAAMIFMFGGSASARLQHTGMIISYSFFPLALWSLEAALDRCSLRLAVVAGCATALVAIGRDQVAYLLCLTLVAFALRTIVGATDGLAYLRSRWSVLVVAPACTVALTAVPILLTMQFLHGSNRPGIAFGVALEGSLNPVNLVTLFAPNVFGSLDRVYDYWGPGAASTAGNDWTDRSIDYLFAGTLPFVLLLWHGLIGGRAFERRARLFASIAAVALLYACGRYTPVFGWCFDWIPGVSLYRRPADSTFVLNLALAFLAGELLQQFKSVGAPGLPRQSMLLVGAFVAIASAVLLGTALAFARETGHLAASCQRLIVPAVIAALIAGAMVACRAPAWRSRLVIVLVAGTAAQLVWRNAASPLNAEPAGNYSAFGELRPDQAHGLAMLQAEIAARRRRGERPRVEVLGIDGSWQNASLVFKLEDTAGYNPLRIAAYERAVGVGESANDLALRSFPDTFRGYNSRLAALLGLDYLILDRPIDKLPRQIPRPRGTLMFSGAHIFIYRLAQLPVPRAYVATRVHAVRSDDAIDQGSLPSFDTSRGDALVDTQDMAKLLLLQHASAASPSPTPAASIVSYGDNRVTVEADAPAGGGLLVLHDLFYPGWVATVDGTPAPLVRANLLFRGVEIPPGHHRVEFAFQPFAVANLKNAVGLLVGITGR